MNKRHYEHTLPNIRGSLSNTYFREYMPSLVKNLCRSAGINLIAYYILFIIRQIVLRNFYQWMVSVKFEV